MPDSATDELSLVFHALADPTRRAILSRLSTGEATAGELAEPFAISRPAVSQHLRVLESAGLIDRNARAQWRTCTIRTEPLDDVSAWIDEHRALWTERFDLLERLSALKQERQQQDQTKNHPEQDNKEKQNPHG
ncbi:ArsR/SmtB family transcription factor [Leifsonia sp. Leaf264]|uniref:ArsR/SmtB family transcription factor n=1 Tax=Leifsonia sp. Leaf264 TaxID=1736314 RepID=UPI0006F20D54|nr:metalloregulator ArsR/SmtB family transcription factor [Leifsonia sp. Leaf264]KQO95858.1 ArsR family transcriptional regulator [Leifsonia sp. Leaf264]